MAVCSPFDADVTWQVAAALMDVQPFAAPPVLELRDVTYRRDGSEIIRGVSFTVRAGEHWAMLGPNGAGKSTLLGFCGAVTHPTSAGGARAR
jgi:ABC-type molybdenum transport system ATPase subunit/photorepair protein PhrA